MRVVVEVPVNAGEPRYQVTCRHWNSSFYGGDRRYVIEEALKLLAVIRENMEFGMPVTVKVDTKGVLAF